MRCDDDVFIVPEPVPLRQRFGAEHIQACSLNPPGIKCRDQRLLIDDTASRNIDYDSGGLQLLKGRTTNKISRTFQQRDTNYQKISARP